MAFKHITSRDNNVFKHFKKVADNAKYRRSENLTLLDGVHLIESYLDLFGEPVKLIIPEGKSSGEAVALKQQFEEDVIVMLPTLLFAELTPVASSTGILALVEMPVLPEPEQINCALLIEDIQDPGNLGSLMRTAAAAGVDVVYLSTGCTQAWSPKCLRGGQGAQFVLPVVERVDLQAQIASTSLVSYATVMDGESLYVQDFSQPTAIVVGNEGRGLKTDTADACDHRITIPMAQQSQAGVESLNAAAATAVVLFERYRQSLSATAD